jgi:hypothetical protein
VRFDAPLKPLPGNKKNFKKSENNACFLCGTMVGYMYMIKNYEIKKQKILLKRLEKRVAFAKKVLYNNPYKSLFEVTQIINNTNKEKKHYVKN